MLFSSCRLLTSGFGAGTHETLSELLCIKTRVISASIRFLNNACLLELSLGVFWALLHSFFLDITGRAGSHGWPVVCSLMI